MQDVLDNDFILIYVDEAHIHLDTDEGYGWSVKGERFWVSSSSPGKAKVSFYGVYVYNLGEVRIFPFQRQINLSPITLGDRLWVTTHLDPDQEKLRVSS